MINQLYEGAIASRLGELTSQIMGELTNPSKISIEQMDKALDTDPVAFACCELKASRAIETVGDYKHNDGDIDNFVNDNLKNINGNIEEVFGQLSSSLPFGFAIVEIIWRKERYKNRFFWKVDEFRALKQENVRFKTEKGNVSHIIYQDGGIEKKIPISKVIIISNGFITKRGAKKYFGNPELKRAYPYIRLKSLIFAELGVSAKRTATGLLWGQGNSNLSTVLKDETGKPLKDNQGNSKTVPHTQAIQSQLKNIENNSFIVTDENTELNSLNVPGGERFWQFAKDMLDEQIMRAFSIPELVWSGGNASLGQGAVSNVQLTLLDSSIQSIVTQIKNGMIEKVIRPLIINNFGHQKTYGNFERQPQDDPQMETQVTSNLITALSMGLVSTNDTEAINELRRRIRLEPKSNKENEMQQELEKQIQTLQEQNQQLQEKVSDEKGSSEAENIAEESQQIEE